MKLALLSKNNQLASVATGTFKNAEDEAKFEQIFCFAYDSIETSCTSNHPDFFSVLEV